MTETEWITLKHVLKFDRYKIDRFDNLNLDPETRAFIIFEMILNAHEKGRNINEKRNG